jgi:endonuclease G
MAKRSRKKQSSPRCSRKLRLRYWIFSFFAILVIASGLKTAHYFGSPQTREAIERGTLAFIDLARESSLLPAETVFWLDALALNLPLVYGTSVDPGVALEADALVLAGTPLADRRLTFLENDAYLVGYDEQRGNPAWCAYRVFEAKKEAPDRPESFETDRRTRARVATELYVRSGFDRGHMAPNHAIAVCYGAAAQAQTFLMSNVVPQRHGLNAGVWKSLEQRVLKRYTRQFGDVWVVCGPVYYSDNPKRLAAKKRGVVPAIPDAFFLIVVDREEASGALRSLAFLVPHEDSPKNDPKRYLVSIDAVEQATGLDFFSRLPETAQFALEARVAKTAW